MDVSTEKADHSVSPLEKEGVKLEIEKLPLGNAVAYRLKLDNGPEDQTRIINELRELRIISFSEDEKTTLGYIRSREELTKFIGVANKYQGKAGFGFSFNDSRIWLVHDPGDKDRYSIVATSSATNAAARVVYGELGVKMGTLSEDILAHRYLGEDSKLQEGSVKAVGSKQTILEGRPLSKTGIPDNTDSSSIEQTSGFALLMKKFEDKQIEIEKIAALAVLGVDVRKFSSKIHELTKNGDITGAENYLTKIIHFLTLFEHNVKKLATGKNPRSRVFSLEWQGDAGGVLIDTDSSDILEEGLNETLGQFDHEVIVKFAVVPDASGTYRSSSVGIHTNPKLEKRIEGMQATL
jgi:hypothetical protein